MQIRGVKMKHYLTEKQVLKKLDIVDFRHLSKDKVIKFASMIPDMQIEVAEKALEQFPNFASTSLEIMNDYKSIIEDAIKSENESALRCYDIFNRVLSALEATLNKDDLSIDDKKYILGQMKEVAELAAAKDSEHKHFLAGVVTVAGAVAVGITAILASSLGSKIELPCNDTDDDDDDEYEEDN